MYVNFSQNQRSMEEERKPRKTHIKIIHHHVHHYHYHRDKENDNDLHRKTIEKKKRIYSKSNRTHRHRHHHRHSQSNPERPNKDNEPSDYSDDNNNNKHPTPNDDDNSNDSNPPYDYDDYDIPQDKPKRRKPKKIVTYYIPEGPNQDPYDNLPPNIPDIHPKPILKKPEREKFPYPIEKLRYLKKHPLPENEDEPPAFGYPNIESPKTPPRRIRFITEFPKYTKPKNDGYSYWTDVEAVLIQERLGGYVEIPPKQLPMMYPFTQMSPRKLPWDFSEVELVPTRPNKPIKPVKPKSFSYYEQSILEIIRIPTPGDRSIPILRKTDEFEFVESWIKTCLWHPFKKLTGLTRLGFSSNCLEFERNYSRIHLVLFPCDYPLKYENNLLPQTIVVHRCVTSGYDLIYLLKKIKKIKVSFLLCAADLGNEAIDYHPKCLPTQYRLSSLRESGFDSLFFREVGVESILILDSSRVVPLYACQMSY